MNFEILREMESFTQKMFNNIIGFQEKDHDAWRIEKSFTDRIKELPLHYLIFSNADRDPDTHGPTVAHYYPLRWEMQTLARFSKIVAKKPVVFDIHARNGFIGSLLGREGVKVVGFRDPGLKPNQISDFYDANNYELRDVPTSDNSLVADVVFSSWMPSGEDYTDRIQALSPSLIIYTFSNHRHDETQQRQCGTNESFGENLSENYQLVDEWTVKRRENLLHDIWPDLSQNPEEIRTTRIYARKEFDKSLFKRQEECRGEAYPWEKELLMTETAHAARQYMAKHGFPTPQV